MTIRRILTIALLLLNTGFAFAAESTSPAKYQLGHGYTFSEALTVGGYFSTEFKLGDNKREFVVDDLALLAYGRVNRFSYLMELESVDFYVADFENDDEEWNRSPAIERLYIDYDASDYFSVRIGKQITPIGYWNLQPINVLRETTSNPALSRLMFPKFLTGVDFSGYTPFDERLTYHFYAQVTEDLDDEYINIPIDQHFGMSLEKQFNAFSAGFAAGQFKELNDTETRYLQLNARYRKGPYRLQVELNHARHDLEAGPSKDSTAAYLQGELHLTSKHALVSRIEYFRDRRINESSRLFVLGYSYRPQFPISLKAEYQWHSESDRNQFEASFSVLF